MAHREMNRFAEKAMELDPKDPTALLAMGAVRAYEVKAREAISLHKRSLARAPQNSRTLQQLARAHALTGRYKEERGFLRKARRYNPLDPSVLSALTYAEFNLGDLENAFDVARANLKWNTTELSAQYAMANLLVSSVEYDEAFQLITQAIDGSPNSIRLVDLLGDIYAYVGMPEEDYEISKRVGSQRVFKDAERGDRAAVKKFLAEKPNWDWAGDGKGYIFFFLCDYNRALPFAKNAIKELEITGPAQIGMVEVIWCLHWADLLQRTDDPEADAMLSKIEEALEAYTPDNAELGEVFVAAAGVQMIKRDQKGALDWLEAAFEDGHIFLHLVASNPKRRTD